MKIYEVRVYDNGKIRWYLNAKLHCEHGPACIYPNEHTEWWLDGKLHRKDARLIERFEPFCMGAELGNAYSELNDPVMQRQLFEEQESRMKKGDEEAHPFDRDFINALEVGLPPTGGLGLGIARLMILLLGQQSIRDVILFPFMKPEIEVKTEEKEPGEKTEKKKIALKKTKKAKGGKK